MVQGVNAAEREKVNRKQGLVCIIERNYYGKERERRQAGAADAARDETITLTDWVKAGVYLTIGKEGGAGFVPVPPSDFMPKIALFLRKVCKIVRKCTNNLHISNKSSNFAPSNSK